MSKVKNGKKTPYLHVVPNTIINIDNVEALPQDINEILAFIDTKDVVLTPDAIVQYLESEIKRNVIKIKLYQEILRRIK